MTIPKVSCPIIISKTPQLSIRLKTDTSPKPWGLGSNDSPLDIKDLKAHKRRPVHTHPLCHLVVVWKRLGVTRTDLYRSTVYRFPNYLKVYNFTQVKVPKRIVLSFKFLSIKFFITLIKIFRVGYVDGKDGMSLILPFTTGF